MAVIGEELEVYVRNQIKARQTLHGSGVGHTGTLRTDKQINLLNSNTSWIKLASGVSVNETRLKDINIDNSDLKGMGLAKNNILFSGISKISSQTVEGNSYTQLEQREGFLPRNDNSSYTYGSFGFSPMPGIISTDIKTLTRGSLKKATVKLTANNKQQFDIIDLLYMRLGYTVLLEWGNSIYTTNGEDKQILRNTLIEEKFFESAGSDSYFTFLEDIEEKRAQYAGNYDALLGKVSNFNWSFNTDGSYDIELTIISLGDVIESLKSNLSVDEKTNKFLNTFNPTITTSLTIDEESKIDEETSSADIITAMLAIWKFTNRNEETGTNVQILTPDATPTEQNVGILLSTIKKENISSTKNDYEFIMKVAVKVSGLDSKGAGVSDDVKRWGTGKYQFSQKFSSNNDTQGKKDKKAARKTFYDNVIKFIKEKGFRGLANTSGTDGNLTITTLKPLKIIEFNETYNSSRNVTDEFLSGDFNLPNPGEQGYFADETKESREDEVKITKSKLYEKYSQETSTISNPLIKFEDNDAFKLLTKPNHYYIRFGALLEYIKDNIIIKIKNKDTDPIFEIDNNELNTYMYSLPNQISLDPRVCVVRNDQIEVGQSKKVSAFTELEPFKLVDNGSTNDNVAYTLNIYLNFDFVQECLKTDDKGNVSVYQLISNICTGLNKALGGINNLEPIIDESSNTLKILDTTPIPGYSAADNGPGYKLQIYGYDKLGNNYISNFVRKVDLKTAITPEYATMITVGATAGGYVKGVEATAFSKWNIGLTDRFKEEFLPPNGTKDNSNENEADTNYVQTFIIDGFANRYGLTYFGENKKLSDNIIEKNISIVTEYYKWLIAENTKGKAISGGTVGFIPFKLGLTLDGISGIKIYNVLRVNTEFLPKAYGKSVDLIITGVSHRLNDNDWETSIESTVMPKTGTMALAAITSETLAASIKETIKKGRISSKNPDKLCGLASANNVNTVYPKSIKWQGGNAPVIVQVTNKPSVVINLSSQPVVTYSKTIVTAKQYIQAAEKIIDQLAPSASKTHKKQILISAFSISKAEQGYGDGFKGFNNNISGVESSGFSVYNKSDTIGKVSLTEGGTGKKKYYYAFSSLSAGLVPLISKIMDRNMFATGGTPNEFAWRYFRDWNGYGARTKTKYQTDPNHDDCDIIASNESIYKNALSIVNSYSKYK
jgi:hypothetical protein